MVLPRAANPCARGGASPPGENEEGSPSRTPRSTPTVAGGAPVVRVSQSQPAPHLWQSAPPTR